MLNPKLENKESDSYLSTVNLCESERKDSSRHADFIYRADIRYATDNSEFQTGKCPKLFNRKWYNIPSGPNLLSFVSIKNG